MIHYTEESKDKHQDAIHDMMLANWHGTEHQRPIILTSTHDSISSELKTQDTIQHDVSTWHLSLPWLLLQCWDKNLNLKQPDLTYATYYDSGRLTLSAVMSSSQNQRSLQINFQSPHKSGLLIKLDLRFLQHWVWKWLSSKVVAP